MKGLVGLGVALCWWAKITIIIIIIITTKHFDSALKYEDT